MAPCHSSLPLFSLIFPLSRVFSFLFLFFSFFFLSFFLKIPFSFSFNFENLALNFIFYWKMMQQQRLKQQAMMQYPHPAFLAAPQVCFSLFLYSFLFGLLVFFFLKATDFLYVIEVKAFSFSSLILMFFFDRLVLVEYYC